MQLFIVLFSAALVAIATWVVIHSRWSGSRRRELPPGPPPLPIVGNLFQLGRNLHKSLAQLAKTYGPVMSIQFGTRLTIVVSSPEMAKEILHKQGLVFSDKFNPDASGVLDHDRFSMVLMNASSERWKKLRRIAREKLFSNQALETSQALRRERLQKMTDHISKCSDERRVIDIREATFTVMSNLIFATLFSVDFVEYGSDGNNKLRELVTAINGHLSVPNISDLLPIFSPLDLQRLRRNMRCDLGSLLEIVGSMIEQRLQARKASSTYEKKDDFLEMLLDLVERNEYDLSIKEIKHFFADIIFAGTDTTAPSIEWAMVELLLHHDKLAKLKAELKSVVGEKRIIEESDISRLPYLQAVIKEALRYHPITPLLLPRASREETRVNGYIIPKDTRTIVNFWAITRDPSIWKNPECFEPERFLDSNIDFGGQHFELIPFSSGRRICPGMPLANRVLHCMLATLCHNFDWKVEASGVESNELENEEMFGLALEKKNPLKVIPIKVQYL